MADCPRNEICPFYSHYVQTIPDRANELRERYCLGNYLACARYAVAKARGGTAVPISLFPHQHAEARTLIASSQE
jgi:hypothetical protein